MSENWNFDCIGWFVIESDLGPTWSHNGDINEQSFTSPQTFLDIAGPLTRTPGAETLMGTGVPSFLQASEGMPAIWNHHHILASKCRAVLKLCDSQRRPYRQKESQLFPGAFSSWLSGRKRASCDCVHGALVSENRWAQNFPLRMACMVGSCVLCWISVRAHQAPQTMLWLLVWVLFSMEWNICTHKHEEFSWVSLLSRVHLC